MPKAKKKRKVYFGLEVQDAIVRYNLSENDNERNQVYQEEIHRAFDKLAENIINTFKFSYFDYGFIQIKNEVVSFMVMNIHKYDHTKGSKAFSYFSVVAKNYLILHNNANYKRYKTHDQIDTMTVKNMDNSSLVSKNDTTYYNNFIEELVTYFEHYIPRVFSKKRDIDIAFSIVELMKNREDIEYFNKKSLYILIREMTDVNTSHITSVVNVLKKHYKKLANKYYKDGTIVETKSGSFF